MNVLCSLLSVSLVATIALENGPPVISNHSLTENSAVSSTDMSSGLIDLPAEGQGQDSAAELSGQITNRSKTVKVRDIKLWFEGPNGKLTTSAGGAPATGLKVGNAQSPGGLKNAPLAGSSGGVATFNMPGQDSIEPGSSIDYEAQIGAFTEPNNYKIKMAFSSMKADKHYEIGGEGSFDRRIDERLFDGHAPSIRSGVVFGVVNEDGVSPIEGVTVELISNDPNVELLGGDVLDATGASLPSAAVSILPDGVTASVSGLDLENPEGVSIWLDLTQPYQQSTVFRVRARYP